MTKRQIETGQWHLSLHSQKTSQLNWQTTNGIPTQLTNQVNNQSLIPSSNVIQLIWTLKVTNLVAKRRSLSTTVLFRTTLCKSKLRQLAIQIWQCQGEWLPPFLLLCQKMQPLPQCFSVSVLFSSDYPVLLTSFAEYRKRLPYLVNTSWLWIISRGIWANQKQKCFEWITTIMIITNTSQKTITFWSVSGFEEWSGASLNHEHGIFYPMFLVRTDRWIQDTG